MIGRGPWARRRGAFPPEPLQWSCSCEVVPSLGVPEGPARCPHSWTFVVQPTLPAAFWCQLWAPGLSAQVLCSREEIEAVLPVCVARSFVGRHFLSVPPRSHRLRESRQMRGRMRG